MANVDSFWTSKIKPGPLGCFIACIGAFLLCALFGALLASLALAVSRIFTHDVANFMLPLKIGAALTAPLAFLGYPHWYVLHSLPSKIVSIAALALGAFVVLHLCRITH